jgi:HAD superfamily hydrolase (TIGR01450 family)
VKGTTGPLLGGHDLLLLDLDGVLYVGDQPVEGAAAALTQVRDRGVPVAFVTNNAARTPQVVAEQLRGMGVEASAQEVVTSAMAAAQRLADDLEPGSAVLVVGGEGVRHALIDAGLRPVTAAEDHPVAVVQGWSAEVGWRMFAEATVAVRAGARWVATNLDPTLPSPRGPLPGNGSMVAALATALGRSPEAVGKPEPALFQTALRLSTGERPLVVGDRLDTDIAGARAAGIPSLLVLTGVSAPIDLVSAPPGSRPDYVGRDLGALDRTQTAVDVDEPGNRATCGGWVLRRVGDGVEIETRAGSAGDSDGLDGLRSLCGLAWAADTSTTGPLRQESLERTLDTLDLD